MSNPHCVFWVTHQIHVSSLSAQARQPYPPGYGFPLPFSGRPSLLGSSCAHCGIGPSFRRLSGLLVQEDQTTMGLPRSAPVEKRWGRVPPIPQGLGVPTHHLIRVRSAGLQRTRFPSPVLVASITVCDEFDIMRPHQRFTLVHPFRLPLARSLWMIQSFPWAFVRLLSHASLPNVCADRGLARTLARIAATHLQSLSKSDFVSRVVNSVIPLPFSTFTAK